MNRRLSLTTAFRSRTPTNDQTAHKFTNMVWDHSEQMPIVPNPVIGGHRGDPLTTMNAGGHPKALHVEVGGSPDAGGRPFDDSPQRPAKIRY